MMNMGMQIMEQLLMVTKKKRAENTFASEGDTKRKFRELEAVYLDPFQAR